MITAFGAGQPHRRARHETGCYRAQELDASRLEGVLERVVDHKINKLDELRQWNYLPETQVQDAYLLYRGIFIKNFLRYLAEKTLLLKTTNFRGDYPGNTTSQAGPD